MQRVNKDEPVELEFDYYLCLAKIIDEGYPSIPHLFCPTYSVPVTPNKGQNAEGDKAPEEHATEDAPFGEESR